MISALSLADRNGVDVALLRSDEKCLPTDLEGFWGIEAPRQVKRPRPVGHGALNDTKYGDGRLMSAAFECIGTDYADTESVFHAITAPMVETLDYGAALLKWTGVDTMQGLVNQASNPSFEADVTTNVTATGGITRTQVGAAAVGSYAMQVASSGVSQSINVSLNGTYDSTAVLTATIWAKGNVGGEKLDLFFTAGANFGPSAFPTVTLTTAWQQFTVTVNGNWNGSFGTTGVTLTIRQNSVGAATWFLDGICVTRTATAPTRFDGESEWCYWNGTQHLSASTFDHSLQRLVKLDSDVTPHISGGNDREFVFQAQFFAEDPRAYTVHQDLISSTALSTASGGLVFPMKFPFKFTPSGGGTATVTNKGNRPTPPIFRIYGMCVNPAIVNVSTGDRITIAGTIANGDYLEIDVANRTAKLNGGTLQNNLVDSVNTTWYELPRGTTNLQLTSGTFDDTARLDTLFRSAYA